MQLEKCKKEGCNVQAVEVGCCDPEYLVSCDRCSLNIGEATSKASIEAVWHAELVNAGQDRKESKNDNR